MLAIIICVLGLVVFLFAKDKPAEAGRLAFAIGLVFALLAYGGRAVLP